MMILDYLREHYGSAKAYLYHNGMFEEDIEDIKQSYHLMRKTLYKVYTYRRCFMNKKEKIRIIRLLLKQYEKDKIYLIH